MITFERVKKLSKKKGWSLQTTAEKAGIGINSIYRWNTKTPSTASLKAVADVLGVSTAYLLGEEDNPISQKKYADIDDSDLLLAFDGKEIDKDDKKAIIELLKFRRFQKQNEDN